MTQHGCKAAIQQFNQATNINKYIPEAQQIRREDSESIQEAKLPEIP